MNGSDQAVVRVGSRDAAAAYILKHRCNCAGPWTPISSVRDRPPAKRFAKQQDHVTEKVGVRCEVCGTSATVTFTLPRGSPPVVPDADQADRKAREQHYLFAHRLLRDRVFADPEGFERIMRQMHARDWLVRLWERAYEETAAVVPSLGADGLRVTWYLVADAGCIIITMPQAEVSPEAVAVAVLVTHGEWRYFPFERVGSDDRRAVLCEWRADGSRRNHHLLAGESSAFPDAQQCLAVLQEQLEDERRRYGDTQPPMDAAYWKPGEEEPDLEVSLGAFQRQPCVFAFHILPAAVGELAEELVDPDDRRRYEVLCQLWRRAGDPDQYRSELESAPITSSMQEVAGYKFLVIELPPPLAPPEPLFVAVRISTARKPRCEPMVHTLELSSHQRGARPILGQIRPDLMHGILGSLPDSELDTFLSAVAGRILPSRDADTMSQLMRYAMVKSAAEQD